MSKSRVVFVPARCNKTGKEFYIREDLAADGMWVSTYGITSIPVGEKNNSSEVVIDYSNHRRGPQYKCPHCGNTGVFLCTSCGVKACCHDGSNVWYCSLTGTGGTFSDKIASSISGFGGEGQ